MSRLRTLRLLFTLALIGCTVFLIDAIGFAPALCVVVIAFAIAGLLTMHLVDRLAALGTLRKEPNP